MQAQDGDLWGNIQCCNAKYVGNTQQNLKERMNGHFTEVQTLIRQRKREDSFSLHFARHILHKSKDPMKTKVGDIRSTTSIEILHQLNPISCKKTFKKYHCTLYMTESMKIVEYMKKDSIKCMNSCSELYGACRHISRFYRLFQHWWLNLGEKRPNYKVFWWFLSCHILGANFLSMQLKNSNWKRKIYLQR